MRGLAVFLNASGCQSWWWWVIRYLAVFMVKSTVEGPRPFCADADGILSFLTQLSHGFVKGHFMFYVPDHLWTFSSVHWTTPLSFHQFHTTLFLLAQWWIFETYINSPTLFFLLKIMSAIIDPLPFHINFRTSISISTDTKKKEESKKKKKNRLASWTCD